MEMESLLSEYSETPRLLPTTYAQLQQVQRKMGLRTTAGAWECLLRLGFAAVERLPA